MKSKITIRSLGIIALFIIFMPVFGAYSKTPDALPTGTIMASKSLPDMQSKSYVLMDEESGQILSETAPEMELAPASITKIMTLLLCMEAIKDGKITYESMVPVSEHAASMGGSQVFLEPGEELSVHDMLKCICIASANDASVAMAELVAGSEETFVEQMNACAKELGMNHTHFVNCYGLDTEGHYSCAKDVAIMSRELLHNYPEITEFTTTWMDTITHKTRKGNTEFGLANTNKLIRTYKGITGLKTGSTGNALYCLSASATRDNMHLIAVIMGAPTTKVRFSEAAKLLDYGFSNYYRYSDAENQVLKVPVKSSMKTSLLAEADSEFGLLLPIGVKAENVDVKISAEKGLCAPIKCGKCVGTITYSVDGKELGKREIYAIEEVPKARYRDYLKCLLQLFL